MHGRPGPERGRQDHAAEGAAGPAPAVGRHGHHRRAGTPARQPGDRLCAAAAGLRPGPAHPGPGPGPVRRRRAPPGPAANPCPPGRRRHRGGRRAGLRRRAGRAAVRWPAATAADRPGAGRTPAAAAVRRAAAVPRPVLPALGHHAAQCLPPRARDHRRVRHPRDHPGGRLRRPRPVCRGRSLGRGHPGRGGDHPDAQRPVRHAHRRHPGPRPHRRRRRGRPRRAPPSPRRSSTSITPGTDHGGLERR